MNPTESTQQAPLGNCAPQDTTATIHPNPTDMEDYRDAEDTTDSMLETDSTELYDATDGWQRTPLPKKRRPTRDDRVSRSRFALQLRPLVKVRIRQIPRHAIASIIGQTAPSAELAEMAAVTFDDVANSAHIALYDETHANRLSKIDHLSIRHNGRVETIEVAIKPIPSNKNTTRGVIQVDPTDSDETIHSWVRCEHAEILKVQKIGKSDRAILTFNSPTLPRTVKYYMELVRVADYRPKRLVCFNCHCLGHMAKYCPSPSVCGECGRTHGADAECESTTYCVVCKETGHLAVSKVCPSRAPKKEESNARSTSSTKQSLLEKDQTTGPRTVVQGVTWASTAAGTHSKLPDNHPLVIENAQLRRSLSELRAEMTAMHKEMAALRKTLTSRQTPRRRQPALAQNVAAVPVQAAKTQRRIRRPQVFPLRTTSPSRRSHSGTPASSLRTTKTGRRHPAKSSLSKGTSPPSKMKSARLSDRCMNCFKQFSRRRPLLTKRNERRKIRFPKWLLHPPSVDALYSGIAVAFSKQDHF